MFYLLGRTTVLVLLIAVNAMCVSLCVYIYVIVCLLLKQLAMFNRYKHIQFSKNINLCITYSLVFLISISFFIWSDFT